MSHFRHELKYLCSAGELTILEHRLKCVMRPDSHAGPEGTYHIRSVYFDDYLDSCVAENLAGVNHREKWRLRAYNCDPGRISLECKIKENDMIRKESCPVTLEQFRALTRGISLPVSADNPKLLNRFLMLIQTRGFAPKTIVGYDRRPYVNAAGNVRVTMDRNIYSSPDIERFFDWELRRRPVQMTGQHLLEVKYDDFLPDQIYRTVQLRDMNRTAFSKYYLCRKYAIETAQPIHNSERIRGKVYDV